MNSTKQRSPRTYSMANRAGAAAQTSEAILDATIELYWQHPIEDVTLAMIAERAGVSVQTVIRKFGGRDDVFTAAANRTREQVEDEREVESTGNLPAIASVLVDHYEHRGDIVMKLLSEETRLPAIAEIVDRGRVVHREWCEKVFADLLGAAPQDRRRRLLLQLVAICDVYTWKLLRRDGGLTREETETAIVEMIAALKEAQQ